MIMSKDEDRRCGQVAELFRPFLEEAGDWCVVRSEQFGYIVLCYYVGGRFEDNSVFDNARDLFVAALSDYVSEIWEVKRMILVNTDYISGKELEMLGLVKESTIQSKNVGRNITRGFKTLVGRELKVYTEMMNETRAFATKRMVQEAEDLGADAVVNIRYSSAAVRQPSSMEVFFQCKNAAALVSD